jgi:hypothetical protein
MEFLSIRNAKRIESLNAGKGKEHDLIEEK